MGSDATLKASQRLRAHVSSGCYAEQLHSGLSRGQNEERERGGRGEGEGRTHNNKTWG